MKEISRFYYAIKEKYMFVWALIAVGVIFLDQITKWLTVINLDLYESYPLIENVFHFTYIQNKGAAFGILQNNRWVFIVVSVVAIVGLSVLLWKNRQGSKLLCVAISMIVGGGIGNMIDRCLLGYVIDFLDFTLIDFAVFNVADSFVCIGVGLFVLELLLELKKEIKDGKNKADSDN